MLAEAQRRVHSCSHRCPERNVKRVLVVHDDSDFRRIYRATLEHAGFSVIETDEPGDVRAAFAEPVALVICDLYVNQVGDESFVSWLHRDERTQGVPVMVVTAWTAEKHRMVAAKVGADTFLQLPVPPKTLLEEVQRMLGPLPVENLIKLRLTTVAHGSSAALG
jgi:DNA-binding response OmpR family regulator